MHPKKPMNFLNKYIAFEGIDASGKSTQANLFCNFLKQGGRKVFCTKEPGGITTTEALRDMLLNIKLNPKTKLFLFLADRSAHIEFITGLPDDTFIVSDRSLFSTIAYQSFGDGLDLDFVERSNMFSTNGILPDITFFIDISIKTMHKRLTKLDAIESKGDEFFEKVKRGYMYIANRYKNVYIINGEKPKEKVFEDIITIWNKH